MQLARIGQGHTMTGTQLHRGYKRYRRMVAQIVKMEINAQYGKY